MMSRPSVAFSITLTHFARRGFYLLRFAMNRAGDALIDLDAVQRPLR
jgi:hypothetical protein